MKKNLMIKRLDEFSGDYSIVEQDCSYKILELENCYVNYDGVVFKSDQVLSSSLYLLKGVDNGRVNYPKNSDCIDLTFDEIVDLDSIVVVNAPGVKNYFHFYYDFLAKLLFFKRNKIIESSKVLAPELNLSFQKDLIDMVGVDYDKVSIYESQVLKVKKVYFLSFNNVHRSYLGESTLLLRKYFSLPELNYDHSSSLIYISRRGDAAKHRKILNEEDVENILERKGFKIINPQKLSVIEQSKIFSRAKFIVSPSGAANTNLIFCSKGTVFFEIRLSSKGKSLIFDFWKDFAINLNLKYFSCDMEKIVDNGNYQNSFYEVDLISFEKKIDRLLSTEGR